MFITGKELWGHIDGTSKPPEDAKDFVAWEIKDARIISWILRSMEAHMVNNLCLSPLLQIRRYGST